MRVGIIGLGRMASWIEDEGGIFSHARALAEIPELELVGGCDVSAAARVDFAERWNVRAVFAEPREMLARLRPELVVIAATELSRVLHIKSALDAPATKIIVCEKPLSACEDDASLIEKWVLESGISFVVNHSRRWCGVYNAAREWIASGRIGEVKRIHAFYGGGIMNIGTHLIDALRYLCGEFVLAQGVSKTGNPHDPDVDGILATADGCTAFLQANSSSKFLIFEIQLLGEKGAIRIVRNGEEVQLLLPAGHNTQLSLADRCCTAIGEQPLVELYRETMGAEFIPRCSVSDAASAVKLARALVRSCPEANRSFVA